MSDDEFKALKATMPWHERLVSTRQGGVVQIIDNRGAEVPLFTITAFLAMITARLAQPKEASHATAAATKQA